MKTSKNAFRLLASLGLIFILTSDTDAQNNRGRRQGNYYGSRSRVSVGIGINPYYNYRPVARPRIYYHPPYRLPYRYHYGPAFGLRIGMLPFGYSRFLIGGHPYYYYDGIYYRPYTSGGYAVAPPPLGAMVKRLPAGAKVTVIDGQKYYVLGGTFYQERISAKNKTRYEVVGTDGVLNTTNADSDDEDNIDTAAPTEQGNNNNSTPPPVDGSVVNRLPAGSTAVTISQQKYHVSPSGVYFQEVIDGNNKVSYIVAGSAGSGTMPDEDSPGTQ